jgi:large subunit ribosomal protein L3e
MSHSKFEHPRHGHLGFLPRKRSRQIRGRCRSFPKDDATAKPHLTAFPVFKAGMTHIVRDVDRAGSRSNKKEVVEAVTILEAPPMVVVGIVGYRETPRGLRSLGTVWAHHVSSEFKRRFYANWKKSAQKAFTRLRQAQNTKGGVVARNATLRRFEKNAAVVRVIAHTQNRKLRNHRIGTKKAFVQEIQINGGKSAKDKLTLAKSLLEKQVRVDSVFQQSEACDICSVSRGHGMEGVVHRWGVAALPRKTHRGLRKVACIGSWHPERVSFTVARAGQNGYHHRTQLNKKIYRLGRSAVVDPNNATTEFDITRKTITPMGGFVGYGVVRNDYVMVKGSVTGPRRRVITLRRPIAPQTSRKLQEKIQLKFIDTSSKIGHGRFQTRKEKAQWMGVLKKERLRNEDKLRKERAAKAAQKKASGAASSTKKAAAASATAASAKKTAKK